MTHLRIVPYCLAASLLAVLLAPHDLRAQDPGYSHERVVPPPVEPAPFPASGTHQKPAYSVQLHSGQDLAEQDRLLLADAESTIAEHAQFAGLEYGPNSWNYRQIVCPTFPHHLFLQYKRNNGNGDVTVFSVSIPRNGEGRVRIIPVLKRGYSLFSPAPINAMTISAFNHIRAEEGETANTDWLGNGFCYAALAGSVAELSPADTTPSPHQPIAALHAVLDIEMLGHEMEVIRFDDATARPRAMEWTMTFNRNGKLVKATHRAAAMLNARELPEKSAVIRTSPVP